MDIRLSNVHVRLPNGKDLFSVADLKIPFGSHILLEGESGGGKTTFLHLLAGLFSPQKGEVFVGEVDLARLNDKDRCDLRRKQIGVVFQKLNLLDHLTTYENVSLALPAGSGAGVGDGDKRVRDALKHVNLEGRENDRVSFMSLGEQQRVAVARVLAQNPRIILADEPTSSLDETNSRFILSALKKAARGKTLIVVSHDHRIRAQFEKIISFKEFRA